jgi:hypothetical protein
MPIGGICLLTLALCVYFISDDTLGSWYVILPILIVYGIGRGIWEGTNKAVIADFFSDSPETSATAFTASAFFTGYAGAIAYFTFLKLPRIGMASILTVLSITSVICYHFAFVLNDIKKRAYNSSDRKAIVREKYLQHKAQVEAGAP